LTNSKRERVLNNARLEGKVPLANPARKARTSLAFPKERKTSCFYLYEVENIGGD
jgi:hypothetical protein